MTNWRRWRVLGLLAVLALLWWAWLRTTPSSPALEAAYRAGAVEAPMPAAAASPAVPIVEEAPPSSAAVPLLSDIVSVGKPGQVPPLPEPINNRLSPAAARALFRRYQDAHDCLLTRFQEAWGNWARFTGVAYLEAAEQARVRAGLRAATRRLSQACTRQGFTTSGDELDEVAPGYLLWARLSAAASGDLAARLDWQGRTRRRLDVDQVARPLLYAALASGEPELYPAIPAVLSRYESSFGQLEISTAIAIKPRTRNYTERINREALWTLVACDLGMDCGADSPTLDRQCLMQGWCGYPSVEAALRDAQIGDEEVVQTELRRQLLVEQIRSGRIAGLFDQRAPNTP